VREISRTPESTLLRQQAPRQITTLRLTRSDREPNTTKNEKAEHEQRHDQVTCCDATCRIFSKNSA
jgi:hypothetical protein